MKLTIGAKIKQLRKTKGLTQDEMAPKVGLSRSTLSNYEIGRRTPHLKDLARIADFFGVGMDYFGVETRDEAFDLLTRARDVFESDLIDVDIKEEIYTELMKLYLKMKEENKDDERIIQ